MSIFIISDEHLGHGGHDGRQGILKLGKGRPFAHVDEMKQHIITRHNSRVPDNPNYLTVHVGDWFWQDQSLKDILDTIHSLHGSHGFLFGNHDEAIERHRKFLTEQGHLEFIVGENKAGGAKIFNFNKHKLTLNHFAQRVWEGSHKGHWHCFGHSHNALPGLGKSFDIGVDGHDFYPWSLEEIEAKMETLSAHHTLNNTGEGMIEDVVKESPFDHLPEGSH
jgi:calcineurin-like phosphoesterase family protein